MSRKRVLFMLYLVFSLTVFNRLLGYAKQNESPAAFTKPQICRGTVEAQARSRKHGGRAVGKEVAPLRGHSVVFCAWFIDPFALGTCGARSGQLLAAQWRHGLQGMM